MSTQESNNLNRMRELSREIHHNASDIDPNRPVGSPGDPLSQFARNQAELNHTMVETFIAISEDMGEIRNDVQEIKAELGQVNVRQESLVAQQESLVAQQESLVAQQESLVAQQESLVRDVARIDRRQDAMSRDIAQVKGGHARTEVAQEAGVIALDMGLEYVRNVEKLELARWAQENSNSGIDPSELRSFREADLVVEASDGEDTVYIAVEISFTADRRDTGRAQRNAEFLQMFTGHLARAAIASVKNDDGATEQIDNGLLHWHSIERRSLEPD